MFDKIKKDKEEKFIKDIQSDTYLANLPITKLKGGEAEITLNHYIKKTIRNCAKYYGYEEFRIEITMQSFTEFIESQLSSDKLDDIYNGKCRIPSKEKAEEMLNDYFEKQHIVRSVYSLFTGNNYPLIIYLSQKQGTHLHLKPNGIIYGAEEIYPLTKSSNEFLDSLIDKSLEEVKTMSETYTITRKVPKDGEECIKYLEGKNIEEVVEFLKEKKLVKADTELYTELRKIHINRAFRKELLNCVMYSLIDEDLKEYKHQCRNYIINDKEIHGYGPKRALVFAKMFDLNIDIPVIYGLDYNKDDIKEFLKLYLSLGGNEKLVGYTNYGSEEPLSFAIVGEVLSDNFNPQKLTFKKD